MIGIETVKLISQLTIKDSSGILHLLTLNRLLFEDELAQDWVNS